MKKLFGLLLLLAPFFSFSQKTSDDLKVFIDCNAYCDFDFIKMEMNYINFVQDRFTSNIYVMITSQQTGSGGQEIMMYFNGQQDFKGMIDTLKFIRSSVATDAEYRNQMVQYLKLGLTRYLAKTPLASKLNINVTGQEGGAMNTTEKKDPWNFWVMNLRLNGDYSKDDYSKNYSYNAGIDASRTTEKLKVRNQVYFNKNLREITIGQKKTFKNEGYGASSNVVKSINQHWSYGGEVEHEQSEFMNIKSIFTVQPALEYSFFPYKESVKKALTLYYEIGPSWVKYFDSSYYGRFDDKLLMHTLSLNFGLIQNWGNIYANVAYESFLNDFELNGKRIAGKDVRNLSVGGNMDIRIFKGLSLYSYFQYGITKGIYPNIRRSNSDVADILSNTRQYPTTNNFFTYFGISYRFCSIYNNVVNPRFIRNF